MISIRRGANGLARIGFLLGLAHTAWGEPSPPIPPSQPRLYDGRYYEVVLAGSITWEQAKAAAELRTHQGIRGQLATIGSAAEDVFVHELLRSTAEGAELWVGGYQVPCATDDPEPGCGWMWINGEAISDTNTDSPYTNWLPKQPDNTLRKPDNKSLASENHLAIGLGGAFGWNDEGYLPNIRGFVVEYGDKVTIPATACTFDGPGCNPTGAQVFRYPPTAKVTADAQLSATTYRFNDDPSRCGVSPLTLFGGEVVVPPYLCGHPDFIVIKTESTGVAVTSGVVQVENLTEDVLPNNLYGCTNVRQNPAGQIDKDPSHRDVVAWQSSDPAEMRETSAGTGRFQGTVAELTNACGSSRGVVLARSYHFVGLHIYPGAGNEYVDNPAGNHASFVELTRYKLELLRSSVLAAKGALPGLSYVALKALTDNAIKLHDHGRYRLALLSIKLFLHTVERVKYRPVPNANPNGEHTMRASNLEFMYERKVIPYAH